MEITILNCANCGKRLIKPKYACPSCLSDQLVEVLESGKGTIYSHTSIYVSTEQFASQIPYEVILVELANGLRITARIETNDVEIGKPVELSHVQDSVYWFKAV